MGPILDPESCWLIQRSLATLELRMKKQYDTRLKKQRRILLDHIDNYCGDNIYIKELCDNLKKQVDIPIMVHKRRTIRRGRNKGAIKKEKRTKRKFKHPKQGVYSVIELLSK